MIVKDLKKVFNSLCPVKVTYNDEVIFDDEDINLSDSDVNRMLDELEIFLDSNRPVSSFEAKIVHFHHSILDIKG